MKLLLESTRSSPRFDTRRGVFITGTDTEVGKTFVGCALVTAARMRGRQVAVMKPLAAGAESTPLGLRNEDALGLLAAARGGAPAAPVTQEVYAAVNPYCFRPPVSPHIAAAEAGVVPEVAHIVRLARQAAAQNDWLVVEGAGGWLAPISPTETIAELAAAIGLPVLLVVGLRLGCLNHAALTARDIARSGSQLAGWVPNELDPNMLRREENVATLSDRLGMPPLARFKFGADPLARSLAGAALFDRLTDAGSTTDDP